MKFNYLILSLLILSPLLIQSSEAYLAIPPTRAISMINGTGGNVTARNYADFVEFKAGTGIALTFDYLLKEITFNATGGSPVENYCPGTDKFNSYNSTTGAFGCASDNTGSNGTSQTPWLSDIDASQYKLNNASQINVKGNYNDFFTPTINMTGTGVQGVTALESSGTNNMGGAFSHSRIESYISNNTQFLESGVLNFYTMSVGTLTKVFNYNGVTDNWTIAGTEIRLSGILQLFEFSEPSTPSANSVYLYPSDKAGVSNLYFKNDAGVVHDLSGTGRITLISANETDQNVTVLNSDSIARTYSLANNTYSSIIVEAEVEVSFVVLSVPQDILIKIKDSGSTKETFTTHSMAQIGTSSVPIKVSFAQTGSSTITITQSGITSDANTNVLIHSLRIYGVK